MSTNDRSEGAAGPGETPQPDEHAWLGDMLSRHPVEGAEPGVTNPGWLMRGEDAFDQLEDRAHAYLAADGQLTHGELVELAHFLGITLKQMESQIDQGQVRSEEAVAIQRAKMAKTLAFRNQVKGLRDTNS